MSTAAFASAAQALTSWTAIFNWSGTPPTPSVMSLRIRSPARKYGPSVISAVRTQVAGDAAAVAAVLESCALARPVPSPVPPTAIAAAPAFRSVRRVGAAAETCSNVGMDRLLIAVPFCVPEGLVPSAPVLKATARSPPPCSASAVARQPIPSVASSERDMLPRRPWLSGPDHAAHIGRRQGDRGRDGEHARCQNRICSLDGLLDHGHRIGVPPYLVVEVEVAHDVLVDAEQTAARDRQHQCAGCQHHRPGR